jgi:hypothetical protein
MLKGEFSIISSSLGTNREQMLLPNEVEGYSATLHAEAPEFA